MGADVGSAVTESDKAGNTKANPAVTKLLLTTLLTIN